MNWGFRKMPEQHSHFSYFQKVIIFADAPGLPGYKSYTTMKKQYYAPAFRIIPLWMDLSFLTSTGGNEGFEDPDGD